MDEFVINFRDQEWILERNRIIEKCYGKYFPDGMEISKSSIKHLMEDGTLEVLYTVNKSITQTFRSVAGKSFERGIEKAFMENGILFSKQVFITNDGFVRKRTKGGGHVVDFVFPKVSIGEQLSASHWIISCKTTLRERFLQDIIYPNLIIISFEKKNNDRFVSVQVSKVTRELEKLIIFLKIQTIFSRIFTVKELNRFVEKMNFSTSQ